MEEQRADDTDHDARDDGKIESAAFPLDTNVSGKTPQVNAHLTENERHETQAEKGCAYDEERFRNRAFSEHG